MTLALTNESKNSVTSLTSESKTSVSLSLESKTGFEIVDNLPLDHFAGLSFSDVVPGAGGKTLDQLEFDDSIKTFRLTLEDKN